MSDADDADTAVPDGAAVFPQIPAELGVQPLLLAVLHATVFLAGSTEEVVHPDAAAEAVEAMADYLQRLDRAGRDRLREDMACLVAYARQQKWPKQLVQALKNFLADMGLTDGETDE
jgi:hypothetical protein